MAPWLVIHTRPQCEKQLARLLAQEGLRHELPLYTQVRRYEGRTRRSMKPLFPGYVFASVPDQQFHRLYVGNFVANLLPVSNQERFLKQLETIRLLSESELEVRPAPLQSGQKVRIVGGPLNGVEGIVDDPESPRGVIVEVDVIQCGVRIVLPPEQIEPLSFE